MRYTISTIIYSILHSSHGFLSFQKEEEEENVHLLWLMDSWDITPIERLVIISLHGTVAPRI